MEDVPQVVPPMMGILYLLLYGKNFFQCCCKFFHLVRVRYFAGVNAHLSWWPGMMDSLWPKPDRVPSLEGGTVC